MAKVDLEGVLTADQMIERIVGSDAPTVRERLLGTTLIEHYDAQMLDAVAAWAKLNEQQQAEINSLKELLRDIATGDGAQLETLDMSREELDAVLDDEELTMEITADQMRRVLRVLGVYPDPSHPNGSSGNALDGEGSRTT